MEEEVALLEEQLAAANADIERLQARIAEAETLASSRGEELTTMRVRLSEHETRIAEYTAELDEVREAHAGQAPSCKPRSRACVSRCSSASRNCRRTSSPATR